MIELPSGFYFTIGAVIFANIGTILSVLYFGGRAVWFIAKLDSQTKENTKDISAAHKKIREIETNL